MIGIGYALLIDNLPAPPEVIDAIELIDVERDLGMADVLRLELGVALSDDGEHWTIADDGVFSRLTQVRLVLTLGLGLPKAVFDGYVAETNLELSEDPGASKLTVVALDATALMNLEERMREWPNLPDSAIATMIFAEHALIPVVTTTSPVRSMVDTTVIQRDTDIRFLRHLAHRNGFDVYVQPSPVPGVAEGHFHPPTLDMPPQGVLSVNLGEMTNVRSFSVKHQLLRPAAAEVASVDAKTVETQTATVDTTSLTELGRTSLLGSTPPRLSAMRTQGLSTGGEIQTFAQAAVDRSAWAVTVEGELESARSTATPLTSGKPFWCEGPGQPIAGPTSSIGSITPSKESNTHNDSPCGATQ